jgi:hypothetical protein
MSFDRIAQGGFTRRLAIALTAGAAFTLLGCGGKSTATVTGAVTFEGKKVAHGLITFVGDVEGEGTVSKGGKITDGNYSVSGVPLGKVKVGIISYSAGGTATAQSKPPEDRAKPDSSKAGSGPKPPPGAIPNAEASIAIPVVYSDPNQSELTMDVQKGTNEKNWPLTPTERELKKPKGGQRFRPPGGR